jgi:acetyltransferase-like isoleucine patch superfamily enzyme
MRLPALTDHAFASGLVFARPKSFMSAFRTTGSISGAQLVRAVWRQFIGGSEVAEGVMLGTMARLINLAGPDAIMIGSNAVIRGILRNEPDGRIDIGEHVYIGDQVIISASSELSIGHETLVAHGAQIFDNDTHPVNAEERARHFRMIRGSEPATAIQIGKAPVSIGPRCWIGMHAVITKGVSVGEDTVVAAGSVVVADLPAGVVAGGNPARVIKAFRGDPSQSELESY